MIKNKINKHLNKNVFQQNMSIFKWVIIQNINRIIDLINN